MRRENARVFLAGAALALSCAACSSSLDALSAGSAAKLADPGYSLKDAVITETNNDGLPRYTVRAASAEQDPGSGEISLHAIHMKLRDQRGSEWRMQAASGRMPEDASMVALRGAVVVDGTLGEKQAPATATAGAKAASDKNAVQMRTEELDVDTRTEKVRTQAQVVISMAGRELTARGMRADLKQRRLQLESQVHGRFTP